MAGIIKVDRVQSDSNLAFNIAGANVAFMDASALRMVGSNVAVGGTNVITSGRVVNTAMPVGSIIQVVQTVKTDTFTTTSGTPVDVTGLSVSITPTSSSNKILVLAQIAGGPDATTGWYINLVRNTTNLGVGTGGLSYNSTISNYFNNANAWSTEMLSFLDSPSTTSSTTYKIQAYTGNPPSAVVAINRRAADAVVGFSSSITVMEIVG
jgi:hypothetical protein